MKVGSLVECIKTFNCAYKYNRGEIAPKKNTPYTIRTIKKNGNDYYIRLEEIINPVLQYKDGIDEIQFNIKNFREIEFPPNLEEEIQECLDKELVLV